VAAAVAAAVRVPAETEAATTAGPC